jgi:hypothetical protein
VRSRLGVGRFCSDTIRFSPRAIKEIYTSLDFIRFVTKIVILLDELEWNIWLERRGGNQAEKRFGRKKRGRIVTNA